MMQATDLRYRHDGAIAGRRDRTRNRRVFVQRQVRAGPFVISRRNPGAAAGGISPAPGRLVHSDEMHMALLQLWEDSFVEGRCPNCDDHVHSARSVRSGKMMPFDNPLIVVRTETLISTTRAIAVVDGDASMCHVQSCRGRK